MGDGDGNTVPLVHMACEWARAAVVRELVTGREATWAVARAWFTALVICGSHAASKKHPAPTARAARHLRFPIPPSRSGVASL
jgi:hypothetical protein